jgi:hypothetical protein
MAHVLPMPALQVRDPIEPLVLVKAGDLPVQSASFQAWGESSEIASRSDRAREPIFRAAGTDKVPGRPHAGAAPPLVWARPAQMWARRPHEGARPAQMWDLRDLVRAGPAQTWARRPQERAGLAQMGDLRDLVRAGRPHEGARRAHKWARPAQTWGGPARWTREHPAASHRR